LALQDLYKDTDDDLNSEISYSNNPSSDDDSIRDMNDYDNHHPSDAISTMDHFPQLEYEEREEKQMTTVVTSCCLLFGQEKNTSNLKAYLQKIS